MAKAECVVGQIYDDGCLQMKSINSFMHNIDAKEVIIAGNDVSM